MEKKASDFRYNTGETKVPWAAVGENYNAQDLMTIIRFMMKGKGEAYDEALKTVEKDVLALDKVSAPPAKLSLDVEVGKAENMCDEYLHTTGSTFLTNCTAGFEIACKYTGLKPGDEVIVPAITFAATMAYPLSIGCKLHREPTGCLILQSLLRHRPTNMRQPCHMRSCPISGQDNWI